MAFDSFLSRIHQKKGAGTIGVFRFSTFKTPLTKQSCLLIADRSGDGNGNSVDLIVTVNPEESTTFGNIDRGFPALQQRIVPVQFSMSYNIVRPAFVTSVT